MEQATAHISGQNGKRGYAFDSTCHNSRCATEDHPKTLIELKERFVTDDDEGDIFAVYIIPEDFSAFYPYDHDRIKKAWGYLNVQLLASTTNAPYRHFIPIYLII